jgi:type II secretory pathway component GspD/PulD (secretin)
VLITLKTVHDLTRSEAIKAVEDAMAKQGFTIVQIGEKFFKVLYKGDEWPAGRRLSSNASSTLPSDGKLSTDIVQLKYAAPDEVVKALSSVANSNQSVIYIPSTESLILRDYTDNVKRMRMLDMVEKLDVEPAQTIKSEVIPIRRALAKDIAARIPHFAQTKLIADERTNSLLVFANDADMKMIKQLIWQAENGQDIR